MKHQHKCIAIPCDCKCCMFVIQKEIWSDGTVNYDISVQDARYDHGYNTLWGRIKRAAKVLFGKPIYYNGLYLDGEESFKKLRTDMEELARFTGEPEKDGEIKGDS